MTLYLLVKQLLVASDRLQQGSSRPSDDIPTPLTRIEYHSPHPFPAPHIARQAIDHYFKEFHVAHPLLKREVLQSCLERAPNWSTRERINLTSEQRHDIFQIYMAIAIGSIRLFREKTFDQHPFGFFSAALEMNPPAESRYNTLGNIENLILIARFGVYYNIGMYKVHFTRPTTFLGANAIDRMLTVGAESSLYGELHRVGST
ncbi:hypothetical protein H9Q72_002838 [Fusarium xylarioides]|uniref:Transcription factor domain-containing protein n=1 Tax=Fusarium xylarioides TaxID=221167 RepID=A0A9P7I4U4_9HYPO|nr:hypothetical protein H9Q72_002838 [Fusarium xylarioides]